TGVPQRHSQAESKSSAAALSAQEDHAGPCRDPVISMNCVADLVVGGMLGDWPDMRNEGPSSYLLRNPRREHDGRVGVTERVAVSLEMHDCRPGLAAWRYYSDCANSLDLDLLRLHLGRRCRHAAHKARERLSLLLPAFGDIFGLHRRS